MVATKHKATLLEKRRTNIELSSLEGMENVKIGDRMHLIFFRQYDHIHFIVYLKSIEEKQKRSNSNFLLQYPKIVD